MKISRANASIESSWHDLDYALKKRAITFEQLAYAHLARRGRIETRRDYVENAKYYYPRLLRRFCAKHGTITDSYDRYWPADRTSVVYAVTTSRDEIWIRYFPNPGQDTATVAEIENLLSSVYLFAKKVREILPPGASRRNYLDQLFEIIYSALVLLDEEVQSPSQDEAQSALVVQRLASIRGRFTEIKNADCADLAVRQGRFVFFLGMLHAVGILSLCLTALIVVLARSAQHLHAALEFVLPCVAGSVGAVISVMNRVATGDFTLDWRVGWEQNRMLGMFRPLVGAVVGVVLVVLLKSALLAYRPSDGADPLYLYIGLAFTAGFSERFTAILLERVGAQQPAPEGEGASGVAR